ncbi:MAG: hypothetical protein ACF8R7_05950 [Phycisphaerales bacterium JB039]
MAPRLRPRRATAILALAALAALAGCDRPDPVQTALDEATLKLEAVAPGGALSRPELRATTFREVSQTLRAITGSRDATPGQMAGAWLMIASAEAGMAEQQAAEAIRQLHTASGLTAQIRTVSIERGAATGSAAALAAHDPAPEIAEIDAAIRATQAELESAREQAAMLGSKITSLRGEATDQLEEARALRAAEADMRNQALGVDDITAAEIIADAARIGRQADAHEVQAATLEAEAERLQPEAAQIGVRIEGLLAREASLGAARQAVGARAQARAAEARTAREQAAQYESELDQLTSQLIETTRAVQSAAVEAAEGYERSASSASSASQHARQTARMASGKARQSAAALRLALADHLLSAGALLADLAAAQPPMASARTLAANAERLTDDGYAQLRMAMELHESAQSDFEMARAPEELISALSSAIDGLRGRLQDAGMLEPVDDTEPEDQMPPEETTEGGA